MNYRRALLSLAVFCLAFSGCDDDPTNPTQGSGGTTLRVPADHATIELAMAAAKSGDVVLLAPGVYDETTVFKRTAGGIEAGVRLRPGVTLRGSGIDETILRPATDIIVYVAGPTPTPSRSAAIENLTINSMQPNTAPSWGVLCEDTGELRVDNCDFVDGDGDPESGSGSGGLALAASDASTVEILNCTFRGWGVGVLIEDGSTGLIDGARFEQVTNGVILENTGSSLELTNSVFTLAQLGVSLGETELCTRISRCVFVNIDFPVAVNDTEVLLAHCTFLDSREVIGARGPAPRVDVVNSIIWGIVDGLYEQFEPVIYISSSIVEGGVPAEADAGANLDQDPLFVDAAAGNVALGAKSPARNVGVSSFAWGCTGTNIDLTVDTASGPDLGAIESQ